MKDQKKCEACAKRTSLVGLAACICLAALKLFVGFVGRSRALIASGMCNLSDISSVLMVMLVVKRSRKAPTKRYPYGYGKLEFIAQIGISLLMVLGTVVLLGSSLIVITKRAIIVPHEVVFFTAIISAIVNGLIYKFASCGAKELNSPALRSHAMHNKIDVASSCLVAVGVVATRLGVHWADPAIAVFECAHVMHGSWAVFWDGFKGVMDTSVPREYIDEIGQRALEVRDVKAVNRVRARQAGQKVLLDIAIEVESGLSVLESKRITQLLRTHLRKEDRRLGTIFVQVIPAR